MDGLCGRRTGASNRPVRSLGEDEDPDASVHARIFVDCPAPLVEIAGIGLHFLTESCKERRDLVPRPASCGSTTPLKGDTRQIRHADPGH